ncbi:MAG: glycosyltransferase family 2 protein [Deltaproteobacteria bacterium]|nr:glycosyltransferase family 2 protein [Deltaproteobacteria bacterium]
MGRDFAFVIPVYNHPRGLRELLARVLDQDKRVFVVDDGSDEECAELLRGVEGITLLRHEKNRGKGAAMKTGFLAAASHAGWAVTLDADGQHDPADAIALMEEATNEPRAIVVGCRRGMDGEHTPWTSRFGRGFSNFWVSAAGGPKVRDSQSGFRVYPLPEVLSLDARAERFQWEVEVLIKARWKGLPVREQEVGVVYQPRGERISHFRPWMDFWRNSTTFTRLITQRILWPRRIRARRLLLPPQSPKARDDETSRV